MEGPPGTPELNKNRVIELLKAHPDDLSPLNQYLDNREAEIRSGKDALRLTIEVAEIKRDAGRVEGAKDAFQDAAEHAWQKHEDELYRYCITELAKFI